MRIIGTIEADFEGATEYREGGIGPFFGETRIEEALSVDELLHRLTRAFQRLDGTRAISLYLDDAEVFRDIEGDGLTLAEALDLARNAIAEMDAPPTYIGVTVTHQDQRFYHVIFVEGATDHQVDEAALSVLDTAEVIGEEEGDNQDEGADLAFDKEREVAEEEIPAFDEPDTGGEGDADNEDALCAFMEKLQALLERDLQLVEPEIDVWTDYSGEYSSSTPSIAPGVG